MIQSCIRGALCYWEHYVKQKENMFGRYQLNFMGGHKWLVDPKWTLKSEMVYGQKYDKARGVHTLDRSGINCLD